MSYHLCNVLSATDELMPVGGGLLGRRETSQATGAEQRLVETGLNIGSTAAHFLEYVLICIVAREIWNYLKKEL